MNAKISLLLPTRKRPALAARFLESAATLAHDPLTVQIVMYVDEDDTQSHNLECKRLRSTTIVGPRITMGGYNSACLADCDGDIVVLANDDVVIRTPGWDERLRELHTRFDDRIYLGYPNDLFKGKKVCAFPILSRRTCEILGEPFPRDYRGSFIDYHLLDIFKRLERCGHARILYLADVIFEHMHYRNGKNAYDETYRERRRFEDDVTFLALRNARSLACERLTSHMADVQSRRPRARRSRAYSTAGRSLARRIMGLARFIVPDNELPMRWRAYLLIWFIGRFLAAGGYLPGVQGGAKLVSRMRAPERPCAVLWLG